MTDETTGDQKAADVASSESLKEISLARQPDTRTGAPATPGAPVPSPAPKPIDMRDAMSKILQDIKLPERRDANLQGDGRHTIERRDVDTMLATPPATASQSNTPVTPEVHVPEKSPAQKDIVQSVHTLKHDLQDVVRDQKISVVKAAALEQDRKRPEPIMPPPRPRSSMTKSIAIGGLALLLLGSAALFGVYFVVQERAQPLPDVQTDSLVFAEQTVSLALDGQSPFQLKNVLAEVRSAANASLGAITRIVPVKNNPEANTTRQATLGEFFAAIGVQPPQELVRALGSTYFFGFHTVDKNAPLFVIEVAAYDRAFAGMLAWEERVNDDLAPIFMRVPPLVATTAGIPERRVFTDVVMRNYDVRALQADDGSVAMYYAFPTRNLLVIAESPYTFTEILSRIQAQRSL